MRRFVPGFSVLRSGREADYGGVSLGEAVRRSLVAAVHLAPPRARRHALADEFAVPFRERPHDGNEDDEKTWKLLNDLIRRAGQ